MKIDILLNNLNYRYDIYQIFNIFYSLEEISFNHDKEDYEDYKVIIESDRVYISHNHMKKSYEDSENIGCKNFIKKAVFQFLTEETKEHFPWGTLVGIRPSKIALDLINKGLTAEEIISYFNRVYCTDRDKAQLCIDIAKYENSFVNNKENNISIYLGMPFCPTRCAYCSFASNPISACKPLVEPYLLALKKEIEFIRDYINERKLTVETVYFGGGTPTSVDDEQFKFIMKAIFDNLILNKNVKEFTVECGRPDSLSNSKLETLKKYNVTRISINPQTMNDSTLKGIGRKHSSKDIIDIFNKARELGFDNINMDLIVGLPGEGLDHVRHTCSEILKLSPESVTVHGMSIKRASDLHEKILLKQYYYKPNQKELNSMYNETRALAEKLNMIPYYMYRQKNMVGNMENVGYTIIGRECVYNIEMIEEKQTIIALGADAVTKVVFQKDNRIERFGNLKEVKQYIDKIDAMIEGKIKLLDSLYKDNN
ncbi:coproporphyrinogen III oxidase [Clostridium polynesiense]|uniref:coproporphyrinogen III oxidase n=1 Tax=Clostridium polynesiense TaxID=1325933 RepID=UPI00058F3D73|nr:coproporphyrinogen III oxidase [Clostridium polynesiense]